MMMTYIVMALDRCHRQEREAGMKDEDAEEGLDAERAARLEPIFRPALRPSVCSFQYLGECRRRTPRTRVDLEVLKTRLTETCRMQPSDSI